MSVVIYRSQPKRFAQVISEFDPAAVAKDSFEVRVETLSDAEAAAEIIQLRDSVSLLHRDLSEWKIRAEDVRLEAFALKSERNWLLQEVIRLSERVTALGGDGKTSEVVIEKITRRRQIDVEAA